MERGEDPRPTPHSHWHPGGHRPSLGKKTGKDMMGKDKKTCQGQASGGREEEGGWDKKTCQGQASGGREEEGGWDVDGRSHS